MRSVVVVRVAGQLLALPIERVIETMRPLPIVPATDHDGPMLGTAQIRGASCPVVDLARWFQLAGEPSTGSPRFVIVRGTDQPVALRVDAVLEIRAIDQGEPVSKSTMRSTHPGAMPPDLLRDTLAGAVWLASD